MRGLNTYTHAYIQALRHINTDICTHRLTDKNTYTQNKKSHTYMQADRQAGRQTDRDTHTGRQTGRQTY